MSDVKDIVASIQDAVDTLSSSAAIKQDALFKGLIGLTKSLETRGDVLLNNIKNLGIINQIKVKLERLIIDPKYKDDVKEFVKSYSDIQGLSNEYFSQFNAKFKPSATANGVKQTAIASTLNGLFENGINTGVLDGIKKILQTNINAGGSYAHLTEQLRNYVLTNDNSEGALERYVKTYANTAINQFTAEYNKTIADDLGLEWYGYDGSLLTTSREFCEKCKEKKYIHISEFPAIIAGDFGPLGECKIEKSTGLPNGMMAGTDPGNLVRRRGGWNCGHQMIAVDDSVVPQGIKDAVYSTQAYKDWATSNGKTLQQPTIIPTKIVAEKRNGNIQEPSGIPVSSHFTEIDAPLKNIANRTFDAIDSVHSDGELDNIPIKSDTSNDGEYGAFYYKNNGEAVKITISKDAPSPEMTLAHEIGHYLDLYALGEKGSIATKGNSIMDDFMTAANESAPVKYINEILKQNSIKINDIYVPLSDSFIEFLKYLISPEELFARSYAQFIAGRSEDSLMAEQLQKAINEDSKKLYSIQWKTEDFKDIETEIEKIFIKKGWISN